MPKRILRVSAKCSDLCCVSYEKDGKTVKETDGYVPSNVGIGGGDYVEFDLDLDTGQIIDWKVPSEQALMKIGGDD